MVDYEGKVVLTVTKERIIQGHDLHMRINIVIASGKRIVQLYEIFLIDEKRTESVVLVCMLRFFHCPLHSYIDLK